MEVARIVPFLDLGYMFSVIYDNYERDLKKELWLCHKNMDLSMTEIEQMPTKDRKRYILEHNKQIEVEKRKFKKKK